MSFQLTPSDGAKAACTSEGVPEHAHGIPFRAPIGAAELIVEAVGKRMQRG